MLHDVPVIETAIRLLLGSLFAVTAGCLVAHFTLSARSQAIVWCISPLLKQRKYGRMITDTEETIENRYAME